MKFRRLAPLFLLLVAVMPAMGQQAASHKRYEDVQRKNILKFNVLSPFTGTFSIQHETMISNESSLQLGVYYFTGDLPGGYIPVRGICVTPEYRIYLSSKPAPRGFYAQPFIRGARFWQIQPGTFSSSSTQSSSGNINFYGLAGGFVFGRQWIIADKFSFDMYVGPLYSKVFFDNKKISHKGLPPPMNGYWFRGGITFGYILN